MVLLVKNRFLPVSPTNLAEFYSQYPHLLAGAEHLAAKVPVKVDTTGILYVRQKQWAATTPGEALDNGQVGHYVYCVVVYCVYPPPPCKGLTLSI